MKSEKPNRLEGSCCFVTGGAGFIGSTIVDQLLDAGAAEVRVLDNFVRGSWSNLESAMQRGGVKVVEGDIRDAALVDDLCNGADYVFHQAALRITRCAEVPREAVEVLIDGMQNLLESSVRHKVKKIIAASSASVYGEPSYLPIDEDHPFNNRTMYGAGKIANEQMLRAYYTMFGLPYVAFRYFNAYGPRMDTVGVYTEVMIRWMDAIEGDKSPLIFGDGKQAMDFIFVDDIARANILAAQNDVTDEAFNVGTGVQTSLNELCQMMLKSMDSTRKPEYREARKVGNVQVRKASTAKAEKLLGFKAEVTLEEGLRRLIEWKRTLAPVAVATEAR
jgi:UDP-glucose 4-epimerase